MLKDCRFDAVFASGLVRSIRTADLIVGVQRFSGHVMRDRDLNERDYGSLTGRDKTEIVAEFGLEQVTAWRRSFSCPPPGGESLCEVAQRVGRCYEERIKPLVELGRNVLVVGHGNSLRALFVHLGLKDKKTVEAFEVETGMPMLIDVANGTYVHMDRET
jgi:2,3-bisphosphoglycerate-dependent phosphoglycerate mutase